MNNQICLLHISHLRYIVKLNFAKIIAEVTKHEVTYILQSCNDLTSLRFCA